MKFFIVLQNDTNSQQDTDFLRCPQKDAFGNRPHHYTRMNELSTGDKIFHYTAGNITAISTVMKPAMLIYDKSDAIYYFIAKVHYEMFQNSLHVRSYWDDIKKLLPAQFSPFQKNGHDNAGFLYPCSEQFSSFLLKQLAILNPSDTTSKKLLESEVQIQSTARIGHQTYKNELLKLWNNECAICKINIPDLLIASHAKPWRDCNDDERVDPYNGLLLCAHHDALFDKGFISFDENGNIILCRELSNSSPVVYAIDIQMTINIHEKNIPYLIWHRSHVLRK
ncbi:HNH endonuclease [Caryophanon latum]|uniref:HNH nuclease domain-containing protein n=1 Tax=Caryophanon latum TaxID=33977 RepID=A0A1C0YPW3_9BACL|nr:HNH endonuclease [Caryophanon latum]OCS89192.1 hypothetical protein A6K76_12625 [Caryophanon latum]